MTHKTKERIKKTFDFAHQCIASYTVQKGDDLLGIAKKILPDGAGTREILWLAQQLYYLNENTIGSDPHNIRPGKRLATVKNTR